jgi:hypothetical protein
VTLQNLSITYIYNIHDDEIQDICEDSQHSFLKFFSFDDDSLDKYVKIRVNDLYKIV